MRLHFCLDSVEWLRKYLQYSSIWKHVNTTNDCRWKNVFWVAYAVQSLFIALLWIIFLSKLNESDNWGFSSSNFRWSYDKMQPMRGSVWEWLNCFKWLIWLNNLSIFRNVLITHEYDINDVASQSPLNQFNIQRHSVWYLQHFFCGGVLVSWMIYNSR